MPESTRRPGEKKSSGRRGRGEPLVDVPHLAARLEDRFHAFRERRGRRRGLVPTIIPFTGYGSDGWVRILARVILVKPGRPRDDRFTNARGWRSFFSIPVRDSEVTVSSGGEARSVRSDRGGVVDGRVELNLEPGWNEVELATGGADHVTARIFVVHPEARYGLVSDIDDTVMVTSLPRPFLAAWNTFVLDEHGRRPVPGMSVLYERLLEAHPDAPVIYLSTGAWNVAPTLSRFLGRNLYPSGTLLLTDWGPTHDRWFRSGPAHKRGALERLAEEFPQIAWVLVGDDGQHDEQLYDEFARAHPQNVRAVAIRQLTASEAVFAGGRSKAENHSDQRAPWIYAPDGAGLFDQFAELGVVDPKRGGSTT